VGMSNTKMDKRKMKKVLKPMLASFVYTQAWHKFQTFFLDEMNIHQYYWTTAKNRRLIDVLRELAGGDLMDPDYRLD
jgi:IS1 family transposase